MSCCVVALLSDGEKHSMQCPRHTTEAQHRMIIAILGEEDQHAFFGIAYPDMPGKDAQIHDPNKRLLHTITAAGEVETVDHETPPSTRDQASDEEVQDSGGEQGTLG